ncbi:hypothetical protein Bca52824_056527 [Brassica carinata]|uniref:Uncharacterized protein n=1 Tax=Brassica carinata TaxID=52824 RepID=A0A8X7QQL3_BRACI|nr:hypothetical protein Bca52824_056527 [Brassica carinata]
MTAGRGVFVDQSQRFDIHLDEPTSMKVTDLHFYTWFHFSLYVITGSKGWDGEPRNDVLQRQMDFC